MTDPRTHAIDAPLVAIADYIDSYCIQSELARETAYYCLLDSLGCAMEALSYPECTRLIGPVVPGITVANGARVPGTPYQLDPVAATFSIGALVRWLDYSDAYYGKTVIHPSDTFAPILAVADWLSRVRASRNQAPFLVRDVLEMAVKAYEIMGWIARENDFTQTGLDSPFLGKIAAAGVVTKMLGGDHARIVNAVSNAWIDGHTLATFRRAPNTGSRKCWSAADSAARGVWLALVTQKGEMGYHTALSAKKWGFQDVLFRGNALRFGQPCATRVVENVVFKIAYPAAIHAQTAVEAAIRLHPLVGDRLDDIKAVEIWTHETCMLMIDKSGPLHNFADRDHCLQYMAATGMIFGTLTAKHYEDDIASDSRIDVLRAKMTVHEDPRYSAHYLDPGRQSNSNAICVHFSDGTSTGRVEVEYPLGHPARRKEAMPLLISKFERNVACAFAGPRRGAIIDLCLSRARLEDTPVNVFFDLLAAD